MNIYGTGVGAPHSRILLKLISLFPQHVHFGAHPYPPPPLAPTYPTKKQ